jgi:small subunit ribosomal protein S2
MAVVTMKSLLETGVHFGHRTRKWNPRMKPYIFTERNGIHIIDLQQTLEALTEVYGMVRDRVAEGDRVLFVGTKRQAQETIELEAKRCGMPYVNARWLGGTLTNWRTIRSRIDELETLERRRDEGEFELLTKKEALSLHRRIDKLEGRLGGIREMATVTELLFVVDVRREETAIHEANLLGIPVIALVDTNCNPEHVDYVIPSNDDAIRAIKLMVSKIADAVLEGVGLRKDVEEETDVTEDLEAMVVGEVTDEDLLGEATLAKLKSGEYDEKQARAEEEASKAKAEEEASKAGAEEEASKAGAEEEASKAEAEEEASKAEAEEEKDDEEDQPSKEDKEAETTVDDGESETGDEE